MIRIPTKLAVPIAAPIAALMGVLMLPGVAAAHPDHASGGDFGLLHFVSDPFHVGLSVAALLLFLGLRRSLRRRRATLRQR